MSTPQPLPAVLSDDPVSLNWRCPKCGTWNETGVKLQPVIAGERKFGHAINCEACPFVCSVALA